MDLLDSNEITYEQNGYKFERIYKLLLGLTIFSYFCEFYILYVEYGYWKMKESSLSICFRYYAGEYYLAAKIIGIIGCLLSIYVLYKNEWKGPEDIMDRILIANPFLILLSIYMVEFLTNLVR